MSEANKIASQIIKAEMLGDLDRVRQLKHQLDDLKKPTSSFTSESKPSQQTREDDYRPQRGNSIWDKINEPGHSGESRGYKHNNRVKKFLASTSSLSQMFEQEKRVTSSDEVKMYLKTAAKFSRDDMETKHFSEEVDDSQAILNRGKKRKHDDQVTVNIPHRSDSKDVRECSRCRDKLPEHLVADVTKLVYLSLMNAKPFLSSMSNVIISNSVHYSCDSFLSAEREIQEDTERIINSVREMWKSKGYKCLIMETHLRQHRSSRNSLISCGGHFQVHCLPIKEKHFERSRMSFKHALQNSEEEWSVNKKLLMTDERRIQRILPKGLPYFWVCFDELTNGFGHVIEDENRFSQYFGLEVLSGLLDKDFNPMRLNQRENYRDQFDRSRDFKLLYSQYKKT